MLLFNRCLQLDKRVRELEKIIKEKDLEIKRLLEQQNEVANVYIDLTKLDRGKK